MRKVMEEPSKSPFRVYLWARVIISILAVFGLYLAAVELYSRQPGQQSQPQLARVSRPAVVEPFEPDQNYLVAESQYIPQTGMYKVVVTRSDVKRIYSMPSVRSVAPGTEVKLLAIRYYQHDTALMEFLVIKNE